MRTGIFGGTFNPPHSGHILALQNFIKLAGLEKAIVTVTGTPPHKTPVREVSDEARFEMARLAFGNIAEVSHYEIDCGGKSYTINTLEHFSKQYDDLYLYMGSDMILGFENVWFRFEDIFKLCTIVVLSRTGDDISLLQEHTQYLKTRYGAKIELYETPPFVISSTEVRRKIKNGESFDEYMPEAVGKYIKENGLYK